MSALFSESSKSCNAWSSAVPLLVLVLIEALLALVVTDAVDMDAAVRVAVGVTWVLPVAPAAELARLGDAMLDNAGGDVFIAVGVIVVRGSTCGADVGVVIVTAGCVVVWSHPTSMRMLNIPSAHRTQLSLFI